MGNNMVTSAQRGHLAQVRAQLDKGGDVNLVDERGNTALSEAARLGHVSVVTLLLDRGADINASDRRWGNFTALLKAAMNGQYAVTRVLLDRGASIEHIDLLGYTSLNMAASRGHVSVVRLLLDRGADINTMTWRGDTPLFHAATSGHLGVVRLLVDRGAPVEDMRWNGTDHLLRVKGPIGALLRTAFAAAVARDAAAARIPPLNADNAQHDGDAQVAWTSEDPSRPQLFSKSSQAVWGASNIPNELQCPIGLELMTDPVICADGYRYERCNIEHWLRQSCLSPMTNLPLSKRDLVPDLVLKKLIEDSIAENAKVVAVDCSLASL